MGPTCLGTQVASKRLQNAKSDKYHDNIHKRGNVTPTTKVCSPSRTKRLHVRSALLIV